MRDASGSTSGTAVGMKSDATFCVKSWANATAGGTVKVKAGSGAEADAGSGALSEARVWPNVSFDREFNAGAGVRASTESGAGASV
jgi:hypothetical protein